MQQLRPKQHPQPHRAQIRHQHVRLMRLQLLAGRDPRVDRHRPRPIGLRGQDASRRSNPGLILARIPRSLAAKSSPTVPITLRPRDVASRLAGCSSRISRSAPSSKPKLRTSCSPGPMEPLIVCGWRGCANGRTKKPARQLRYCWRDLPGDRGWDKNTGMKLMKDFNPVNLSRAMSGLAFEMTATQARLLSATSACHSSSVKRKYGIPNSEARWIKSRRATPRSAAALPLEMKLRRYNSKTIISRAARSTGWPSSATRAPSSSPRLPETPLTSPAKQEVLANMCHFWHNED